MDDELLDSLRGGRARVGVLGLGYVGLPLARAFVAAGHEVIGFDHDPDKPRALAAGEAYLPHLAEATRELAASERFHASSDPEALAGVDACVLCVPTPLDERERPDLRFVVGSAREAAPRVRPGGLLVLGSTTYPGTTRDELAAAVRSVGRRPGEDLLLAYAPEREDPGRAIEARTVPRVVGGTCERSGRAVEALFASAFDTVHRVERAEIAEAAKLLENVYRAVNIALVNEAKVILDGLGLDVRDVLDAAETKPYGFERFEPGPGWGGHCIPIDPFYLRHAAERAGRSARFVELAGRINREMVEWVVGKLRDALSARGGSLQGARVLLLGLAYKADVGDVRESPAFPLARRLEALGASVDYHDPHVPVAPVMRDWGDLARRSVPLDAATVAGYDACLLVTAHAALDLACIAEHARLVVDTRGALRDAMGGDPERYVAS